MKKRYWIYLGAGQNLFGPFESLKKAEQWIRQDSADTFADADSSLRDMAGDWSDPVTILQEVKRVRPVPRYKINVSLVTCDKETT